MLQLSQSDLSTLEATATTAAAYLDSCDSGAKFVRLDPTYYQACGRLLLLIFSATDANKSFPSLVKQSAAARDALESVEIGRHIELSRLAYYPQLSVILNRAAA